MTIEKKPSDVPEQEFLNAILNHSDRQPYGLQHDYSKSTE